MEQPLFQKLKEYNQTMLPMHMPGHKRNLALSGPEGYLAALCADCDITEIAGFDNLAEPEGIFLDLKRRAAKLWNSEEAYPLVNGSTCGVLAGIYATVPYGGSVIVARNCHKSVYNGLQLVNAKVRYLMPAQDDATGIFGSITKEMAEEALQAMPDAKLLVITSPTYEGILSDVAGICEAAHRYGVPVLVDSAHGAHLGFGGFPNSTVEEGADLTVQSLHKTLPCLTQTAMLHRKGELVSGEKLQNAVNMFHTSSPSYLLLASVEGCVGVLEEQGVECFSVWEKALDVFYKKTESLQRLKLFTTSDRKDPGKLVISTVGTNLTGPELMDRLREEHRIELEMAAEQYVIAMTGLGDTEETLLRFAGALEEIDRTCGEGKTTGVLCPELPSARCTIKEAMEAENEELSLKEAVGRTAAEHLWAYPPGIPVVVAGEILTEDTVTWLMEKQKQGVALHRGSGSCKEEPVLRVLTEEKTV